MVRPVDEALQSLCTRHINVPRIWVEQCVEFLLEDPEISRTVQQSGRLDSSKLLDLVYEQYLLCDLSSLEHSFLRDNIQTSGTCVFQLKSDCVVQVNYCLDISQSLYSQLKELTGSLNENALIDSNEDPQFKWGPKPAKACLLEITDGVTTYKAFESESISKLCQYLPPGAKILLRAPIQMSQNCLLLTSNSLQILGGHVEELVEQFEPKALLTKLLQESHNSTNQTPSLRQEFGNSGRIKGSESVTKSDRSFKHEHKPLSRDVKPPPSRDVKPTPVSSSAAYHDELTDEWDNELNDSLLLTMTDPVSEKLFNQNTAPKTESKLEPFSRPQSYKTPKPESFSRPQSYKSSTYSPVTTARPGPSRSQRGEVSTVIPSRSAGDFSDEFADELNDDWADMEVDAFVEPATTKSESTKSSERLNASTGRQVTAQQPPTEDQSFPIRSPPGATAKTEEEEIVDLLSSDEEFESLPPQTVRQPELEIKPFYCLISVAKLKQVGYKFFVKARIESALSKISQKENRFWCLRVRVDDGADTLDCDLAHSIIESYLGPVTKQLKKDKDLKRAFLQNTGRLERYLSEAHCLMFMEKMSEENHTLYKLTDKPPLS